MEPFLAEREEHHIADVPESSNQSTHKPKLAMSNSIPLQIAETIQTAHINRAPSPRHDINPSTAASEKVPVQLQEKRVRISPDDDDHIELEELDTDDEDEDHISVNVLRSIPRSPRPHMPPLPDLRFEQSVLHSLERADTWWKVVWVISRDQVSSYSGASSSRSIWRLESKISNVI